MFQLFDTNLCTVRFRNHETNEVVGNGGIYLNVCRDTNIFFNSL